VVATQTPTRVYVPLVQRGFGGKGLAIGGGDWRTDVVTLGARWYYYYSEGPQANEPPGRIPMLRQDLTQFPAACYPYLLVFNEPDSQRPFSASETAQIVHDIEAACPQTYQIVGNVSQYGAWWVTDFLAAYGPGFHQAIGVHCYGYNTADACIDTLTGFLAKYPTLWLTEYNVFYAPAEFGRLTEWAAAWFTGYSPYTNREPIPLPDWAFGEKAWLINADGSLTSNGQVYADW